MVGPAVDAGLRIGSESNPVGDAADIVPTIAELFGVKQTIQNQGLLDPGARSLFDRM